MQRNAANKMGKTFPQSSVPKVHKLIDSIECSPYLCMSCDERFSVAQELLIHTRVHSDEPELKQLSACYVCSKDFSKHQTLVKHMRVHLARGVYECSKCDKQFSSTRLVRKHELVCTQSSRSRKKKVSEPSINKSRIKRNVTKNTKENNKRNDKLRDNRASASGQAKQFCKNISAFIEQGKEFTREFDPFFKHPEYVDVKNGRDFTSSRTVKQNDATVENVVTQTITHPYACAGCEEHFKTVPLLRKHYMEVHMKVEELIFTCKKCSKICASNEDLKQHEQTHSTDGGVHECIECVKRFLTLRELHIHMHIHTKDRRFLCTVCDKRFTQLANLNAHIVIHSDERPFACAQCDLKFKRPDALQRHELLHSNERHFKCTKCDKEFTRAVNLRKHLLFHADKGNLLCKKCDMCFDKRGDFEQHMLEHLREPSFVCLKCKKSFSCEYDRKLHESEHDIGDEVFRSDEQEIHFNPDNGID